MSAPRRYMPLTGKPRVSVFTMVALCSSLLAAPSSGYTVSSHLLRPNAPTATRYPHAIGGGASGWNGQRFTGGGQPTAPFAIQDPSALMHSTSSRDRLFKVVKKLRGGGPTMKFPGYDAAAAAIAAISIPAIALNAGPALFMQGVLLSMVMSVDGFRIREHFVSYGYGFSVSLQAAGLAWLFRDGLHTLSALHVAGIVAYGLRLVLFCRWRDSLACFQNREKRVSQPKPNASRPYAFWGICSMLYALLALPTVYVLRRLPAPEGWVGVSQAGLAIMAVGLLVEGIADWQKSQFKKKTPNMFCDSGLFRLSRHPNYFGEAVFWGGVWLAATPSFSKWYHWAFASIGPYQIVSIILRATGGLEKRQAKKYGSTEDWKKYAAKTPVLVPGTRQYTWGKADKE